eukprot:scaffold2529_cov122-Isochrysis_galbana.AAC.10
MPWQHLLPASVPAVGGVIGAVSDGYAVSGEELWRRRGPWWYAARQAGQRGAGAAVPGRRRIGPRQRPQAGGGGVPGAVKRCSPEDIRRPGDDGVAVRATKASAVLADQGGRVSRGASVENVPRHRVRTLAGLVLRPSCEAELARLSGRESTAGSRWPTGRLPLADAVRGANRGCDAVRGIAAWGRGMACI